jgi:hypothetical protein
MLDMMIMTSPPRADAMNSIMPEWIEHRTAWVPHADESEQHPPRPLTKHPAHVWPRGAAVLRCPAVHCGAAQQQVPAALPAVSRRAGLLTRGAHAPAVGPRPQRARRRPVWVHPYEGGVARHRLEAQPVGLVVRVRGQQQALGVGVGVGGGGQGSRWSGVHKGCRPWRYWWSTADQQQQVS